QRAGHFFVAPDNGLLSFLPADAHFVSLPVPPAAAPTFHARDLFAPAAGQLALGASLSHLGQPITDPYRSPLPVPRVDGGVVVGEVLYVDRFGTLISNIPGEAGELRQVAEQLALAPGGRATRVALRQMRVARGGQQALGPELDFVRGQVAGVRSRGHLGPALRACERTGFTPSDRPGSPAIR